MSLKSLVFTHERKLTAVFAHAVADLPLDWIVISDRLLAEHFIVQEQFDFLLVDTAADGGAALITRARNCECNHACVIFALSPGATDEALMQLGADVYLTNPSELDSLAARIIQDLPLMKHERRWSRRCRVRIPSLLSVGDKTITATVLNLSMGGMMVELQHDASPYHLLKIDLVPPGVVGMQLYGKIVWRGPDSLAGIRFLGLADEQKTVLAEWMKTQD